MKKHVVKFFSVAAMLFVAAFISCSSGRNNNSGANDLEKC